VQSRIGDSTRNPRVFQRALRFRLSGPNDNNSCIKSAG
jgi:hypothetical protein